MQIKVEQKTFKVNTKTVEVVTLGSNYHIEMNPAEVGNNDRLVIQEVVKDIAQTHTLDPSALRPFKGALFIGSL